MAKRSPILGYNHNVRYRGLIFHVQTEDSGQQSPHLFTHLFYGGVIISTRKLVYDAGSAEDAIKGLMQAQHKVVMKDLKRGAFDDKIDLYLVGNAELLPRAPDSIGTDESAKARHEATPRSAPPRPSASEISTEDPHANPSAPEITIERPQTEQDEMSALAAFDAEEAAAAAAPPVTSRTQTAERKSAPSKVRTTLPSSPPPGYDLDPPTLTDEAAASMAAAVAAANATVKTQIQIIDSGPVVQLELDDDDEPSEVIHLSRGRVPRDTQVESVPSDGVPGAIGAVPSTGTRTPEKRSAVGAASLPPARPIARPPSRQAITPPQVVSRPLADEGRARSESDAVEVYAPAPPSVDAPPGAGSERPGQYAQHKRVSQKLPVEAIRGERERSGAIPIPSGLSRPGRASAGPPPPPPPTPPSTPPPTPGSVPQRVNREGSHPPPIPPRAGTPRAPDAASRPSQRPRTPTPARVSASGPAASRAPSNNSGGVVMTRPAVIVGAPAKSASPPRVRKAREEEGRGFGQGLISEKSLDEVILAYLSEDADDK